jgi:hypothetical protein
MAVATRLMIVSCRPCAANAIAPAAPTRLAPSAIVSPMIFRRVIIPSSFGGFAGRARSGVKDGRGL